MADKLQGTAGDGGGDAAGGGPAGGSLLGAAAGGGGQAAGAGAGDAGQGGGAAGAEPWYSGLPGDLVTDKLRRYGSLEEAVRGFQHAQKKIGQKGLEAPDANAPAEEWAEYYAALGRPESPDQYEFQAPEGLTLDETRLKAARERLHVAGLRPEQFGAVMNLYAEEVAAQAQAAAEQATQERTSSYEALKQQWGDKTEERLQLLTTFAMERGLLDSFNASGLGRNAQALLLLDEMRRSVREGQAVGGGGPEQPGAQIDRLKAHPAYLDRRHPEHHKVMEALEKAYRRR
ncbi:MAG: hypothetical protein WC992_04005 [Acholeplasmataceae bacterium]